ncbi:MAG: hypothetical protein Q8P84_01535, partial [Deltaproteobacteria bacterium]|nr:hypothetical protein [Deltaproteobacteria bacterium]
MKDRFQVLKSLFQITHREKKTAIDNREPETHLENLSTDYAPIACYLFHQRATNHDQPIVNFPHLNALKWKQILV